MTYFNITNDKDANVTTIALFKRAVRAMGLDLPEFEPSRIDVPRAATPAEITDAVLDAITAGKDPAADEEVQFLITSKLIHEYTGLHWQLDLRETQQHMEYLQSQAPALLQQMEESFNTAVDLMRQQVRIIGYVDLTKGIPNGTPTAIAAAATALSGLNVTSKVIEHANYIREVAGRPRMNNYLLWYCKPTNDQFNIHNMMGSTANINTHGNPHNIWDLMNDGIEIGITSDPAEYQAREQAATKRTTAEATDSHDRLAS